ncbi:MAG TPA: class I SAM-dependent methyltransferase [Syntrophorhabdaceae bacterium]|nr:class I SAM-dependent methyltransferase [Syntrophorhabdaceae bacterium]
MGRSKEFEITGLEFLDKGEDRQALECFGKAVSLDNLNYSALRSLLFTAHRLGLTPDATRTIQDLLQQYPSDARMLRVAREYVNLVQGKTATTPLTTIFLSKDRPLQLQGCLESLFHHSGIGRENIAVLYKQSGNIYYDLLIEKYPEIRWVPEKNFSRDIQTLFNESDNHILMCCDDMIFTEPFDLKKCIEVLDENEDILNFTLRVGTNITPVPEDLIDNGDWLKWKWYNPVAVRWHYPWAVPATIYRKDDVLRLTRPFVLAITNPNFLESTVAGYLQEYPDKAPPCLASFRHSKCIATHVNRVQDTHCNEFDNSSNTETEALYSLFLKGGTVDWEKITNIDNTDFNLNGEYFNVKIEQPVHGYSKCRKIMGLMPFDDPYNNFNFNAFSKDITGGTDNDIFDRYIDEINAGLIIEIGTWKGASAIHFASRLKEKNIDGTVICIDTWLGTVNNMIDCNDPTWGLRKYYINGYPCLYHQFLANVIHSGLQNYIVPFPNTSSVGAKWLQHHNIQGDFIYIDGSHEEDDVLKDLKDYWPLVKPKGILAGDDWHSGGEGVIKAVNRFIKEHSLHLDIIGTKWMIRKP